MREVLTLQIGQCGNQIGNEFWKRISEEHENNEGRKDRFFYNGNIPRGIFIDTEPRVVDKEFRNNFFIANDGIGAGNNFAQGYKIGRESSEDILDLINRHVEACDSLEGMIFIHASAGGTGSGFGSYLSDSLREIYGFKKIFTSFTVLPTNKEASEVVVQPYNTILTLDKLYKNMNMVVLMDNYALSKQTITSNLINSIPIDKAHTFESLNDVASDVIANFTSSIRFPSHMFCTMDSITKVLCPFNNFKFIVPSYIKRNSSVNEIMNNLIKQKTMLCDYEDSSLYSTFSIMNNLNRIKHSSETVMRCSRLIQPRINFYGLPFYLFNLNKSDSSMGLINSTFTRTIFRKIASQFDQIYQRNAFIEMYKKNDYTSEMFNEARENIEELIKSLESAEQVKSSN
ncbi:TBG [Hepatospora eriocheir]|uniref:TBG n=1 Tax=Hepatospora eriocheir TaxID=1081669 RepID=A0A1X0QE67_9MICR|nr:TBG [Hepatospora eriocheir]